MDYLLPIGSVVLLKGSPKRLMVVSMFQKNKKGDVFDYGATEYPVGMHGDMHQYCFNEDQIALLINIGYKDETYVALAKKIAELQQLEQQEES